MTTIEKRFKIENIYSDAQVENEKKREYRKKNGEKKKQI